MKSVAGRFFVYTIDSHTQNLQDIIKLLKKIERDFHLSSTKMLVDITSKRCNELRIRVIVVYIDNLILILHIRQNISSATVNCNPKQKSEKH